LARLLGIQAGATQKLEKERKRSSFFKAEIGGSFHEARKREAAHLIQIKLRQKGESRGNAKRPQARREWPQLAQRVVSENRARDLLFEKSVEREPN
jgi:hypothetical protein